MKETATEMMRIDRRSRKAEAMAAGIMNALRPYLREDGDSYRDAYYALRDLMEEHGAEFVTDTDRALLGLPPRGPDGWTAEELHALEVSRLEMLTRPFSSNITTPWQSKEK